MAHGVYKACQAGTISGQDGPNGQAGSYSQTAEVVAAQRRHQVTDIKSAPTRAFGGSHIRLTGRIMGAADPLSDGGRMSRIGRRVRAAVNPVSTAATRWWCHSAVRHMLTGYGPTARQRRLIRHGTIHGAAGTPSAGQLKARAAAIDQLLARDDHEI